MAAVEVLSKSEDVERKLILYFAEGAQREYHSKAAQLTVSLARLSE
jgi:phage baseplate assembly protein gpV